MTEKLATFSYTASQNVFISTAGLLGSYVRCARNKTFCFSGNEGKRRSQMLSTMTVTKDRILRVETKS